MKCYNCQKKIKSKKQIGKKYDSFVICADCLKRHEPRTIDLLDIAKDRMLWHKKQYEKWAKEYREMNERLGQESQI